MAQLNFAEAAAQHLNTNPSNSHTQIDDRPNAKIWLNVGMILPFTNENGEEEQVFVSIPKGIAFDTMEKMEARGNNPENNQKIETGNFIMEHFQKEVESLKPGETVILPLVVEARRIVEPGVAGTAASGAENPLLKSAKSFINVVK